ncbi:MAG: sugar ABC transporter substrate-binding protein [Anaerolineaceae bacterium]
MKRFSVFCSVLLIMSMLLTSCAQKTPTQAPATEAPATEAPAKTEAPVATTEAPAATEELSGELVLWIMPNGADPQAAIDAELADFMTQYPNITVTTEVVGWGDAYSRIQTAVQGGEGPCVTQLGTTWVPTFGTMGGMVQYTPEQVAELGGEANFVAASWSTAVVEGKVDAIPWFADVRAIAYRKDVLEKIGVTAEDAFKDVASFEATLQKVKDAHIMNGSGVEIAPFINTGRNDWNVWQNASMWMWNYGGDILNADGTKAAFNTDAAIAGVAEYYGLYGKGLTSADTLELNSAQTDGRFGAEAAAFAYMTGPWIISNARNQAVSGWPDESAKNLEFAQIPAGPGGQYTFVGGSNLGIMKTCKYPDAAFALVKFLTGKTSQIRYANAIGMLPSTIEGQNDPSFTEDPLFSVFIEAAKNGKSAPAIPAWGQVENTINPAFQALWETVAANGVGKPITVDQVKTTLDEAAATVDSLLSQ